MNDKTSANIVPSDTSLACAQRCGGCTHLSEYSKVRLSSFTVTHAHLDYYTTYVVLFSPFNPINIWCPHLVITTRGPHGPEYVVRKN